MRENNWGLVMNKQRGFTLIELLVVVGILAAIAGVTAVSVDGFYSDSRDKLTQIEMRRIAKTINRFRADTGYWPKTGIFSAAALGLNNSPTTPTNPTLDQYNRPENMEWLFEQADDFAYELALPWNSANARGWNPPYVNNGVRRALATDNCDLEQATFDTAFSDNNVDAISDVYERMRDSYAPGDLCFAITSENGWRQVMDAGSPYSYHEAFFNVTNETCTSAANSCVVLQSYGLDGVDDSGADNSDDIILVLNRN